MAKIKVGMIGGDVHAVYYGALMEKHDPLLLRDPTAGQQEVKEPGGCYDWFRGSVHFYFYTEYNNAEKITVPTVDGFEIAKVWDKNPGVAELFSAVFRGRPKACKTFEEVSDDVDLVFIPDCCGDGSDHVKLAAPGIEKRIPTFIDKPFAYEVRDAQKLVNIAEKHETPIMSLSILGAVPHATRFRDRFAELDRPGFGVIKGHGGEMASHIHLISLAQHLFGAGVDAVECMGRDPLAYVHLDYGGRPDRPSAGVILCCAPAPTYHCSMYASAYGEWGAIHSPNIGDFEFPWGAAKILEMIKKMVQTGQPQVSYDEMVECIAIATAARAAQKKGKMVYLKEVC